MFLAIDHVQLAIPEGGEDQARHFWCDVLDFVELPKPRALAVRGGAWFQLGPIQVHVGIEGDFVPAKKAHPAFLVINLKVLVDRLAAAGIEARWDHEIPGVERCHIDDPFGNRIELVEFAEVTLQ